MAQTKKGANAPNGGSAKTVAELREWYDKNEKSIELFKKTNAAILKLSDPTKTINRTYNTFDKTKLRQYMKNPIANYKNIRDLSRYLYYRSSVYRRLIWYFATMIDTNAKSVIPIINLSKGGDKKKVLKSYQETLSVLNNMNIRIEFLKLYITAWREDVAFGVAFYDDTGYFVMPIDPDFCKVTGSYTTGDLSYSLDMTYIDKNKDLIEWVGEPFKSMYNEYLKDKINNRWLPMKDEYCICFKVNIDDLLVPLVPFLSIFNALISLADLEDIQAVADEQQIYKLIVATIPLLSGSDNPDDWAVDIDTAIQYYQKLADSLPDYIACALSPIPLTSIGFEHDQATDVNKVENATKTVLNTAGGAQLLNSSTISGTTAWLGAIKFDEKYGTASLLPQTEGYLNRFLSYQVKNPSKVKMLETSTYTKSTLKEEMLKEAQFGIPNALAINTLNGYNELETLSMNFLQNDVLNIPSTFIPLNSSHTTSNSEGGRPTKSETELTDDGEASRDKRDTAKG